MKYTLNHWQTLLLFLPVFVFMSTSKLHLEAYSEYYKNNREIFSLLSLLNLCVIEWYQTYLVAGFLNYVESKSLLLKLNSYVAPVFFSCILCVSFFKRFVQPTLFEVDNFGRQLAPGMGVRGWAMFFLLALSILNFIYINNKVVANKIALLRNRDDQQYAKLNFTDPLKNLLSTTYGTIATIALISLISRFIESL